MNLRLRGRLFLSYVLLLTVVLVVILAASLLILAARPVSPTETYERMTSLMREWLAGITVNTDERPLARLLELQSQLQDFARENEVRALGINVANNTVRFDSAGTLVSGDTFNIQLESFTLPIYLRRGLPLNIEPIFGTFNDQRDSRWAFAGLLTIRQGTERVGVLLADQIPPQSLETVLARFSREFALLACQSTLLGLLVAAVLAAIVSRNLTRPLADLADAAAAFGKGNFEHQVVESGAPEIRAVASAFNHMSAEIQHTRQSQQDFLANVSHDLKTPLTSIQGYSQAIMDGAAKDPASAAKVIHQEAGRLNRMVTQLTDLARLQAGRLAMQTQPVDLGVLASAIGERLNLLASDKGLRLHVQAPPMPEIAGDGDRLAQVLTNLVSNAIKYTPQGGQIWLTTQVSSGGVEVVVRDSGVGISAEDLPRIFERFYQADKARGPRRGTGLGLAITQEIVQAHGGRITVASAGMGKGSTFTVWLPSPNLTTIVRGRRS